MSNILDKLTRIQAYGQEQTAPGTLPWEQGSWIRESVLPFLKQQMAGSPAGSIMQAVGVEMPPAQNDLISMIMGATGNIGKTMPIPEMQLGEFYRKALFEKIQNQRFNEMMDFLRRGQQNVPAVQAPGIPGRID